jgi:hypothetical protein
MRYLAGIVLLSLVALASVLPAPSSSHAAPVVPVAWNALAADPRALTITTDRAAVIDLAAPALAAAGWPVAQIDPASVQVWRDGSEVPAAVTDDGSGVLTGVRFVADGNDSAFSRDAVSWLTYGRGQGRRLAAPPTGTIPLRWEVDQTYDAGVTSRRGDSWFAFELRSGADTQPISLTLPAGRPAGSSLQIHIAPALRRSGHELELRYAGQPIGVARWDDGAAASAQQLDMTLLQALPAGAITLDAALTSAGTDRVLFDALTFPNIPQALPVLSPAPVPVSPRDLRAGPAVGQAGASYLIITHPSLRDALGPLIALKQAQGDTVGVVEVQWAYDAFSYGERDPAAIRALVAVAAAQWTPAPRAVLLVGAGTVRMRGGDSRAPTPGLTMSDAPIADPLIPPYLVRGIDPSGEIACDTCYTRLSTPDVRDDTLPELPIGRIPARTLDEARTVVAKIVTHATAPPPGRWRSRALLLADNDIQPSGQADPGGPFSPVVREVAGLLPRGMDVRQLIYAPQAGAPGGTYARSDTLRCQLFGAWDGASGCPALAPGEEPGASLLIYVGHGSPWQWAATTPDSATPYLLYLYDVDGRTNGVRLPIVFSMTCYSGNWANPILQSLDERLLLWPGGGSVADFAAVGSGVNTEHARLLRSMVSDLTATDGVRLGAAHLAALAQLDATARDLAYSFHILGDPDTTLPPLARYATFVPLVVR